MNTVEKMAISLKVVIMAGALLTSLFAGVLPVRAETWALLIGIDRYTSTEVTPLKGAVNDVVALKDALIAAKLCPSDNIVVLATGVEYAKPDRGTILEESAKIAERVQPGDTVFVFYSGHGCQDGNKTYLLSADVKTYSIPVVKKTAVDVDDFEEVFREATGGRIVIAYDMCRVEVGNKDGEKSGLPQPVTSAMQGKGQDFSVVNTGAVPVIAPVDKPVRVRWWSCSPGERSYEREAKINGVAKWRGYFSSALESGLRGAAAYNGKVTLASLEKYVSDTVAREVKRGKQNPRLLLDVGGLDAVYGFVLNTSVDPSRFGKRVDATARLVLTGDVAGATIKINGKPINGTEYETDLPDEETVKVRVSVTKDGYKAFVQEGVVLLRGETLELPVTLGIKIPPPVVNDPNPSFNPTSAKEIITLKGHADWVWSATFSPDGRYIVTGSNDGIAKVWKASTGTEIITLKGHTDRVYSASFSPSSKRILTGSWDGTAKVWDANTGAKILTLKGHSSHVYSASFSPDGKRILTGSSDKTAKVWDANTGKQILTLQGHKGDVLSASFSPDGKRILTGGFYDTAKVWDANTGKQILTLQGHKGDVLSASFSPDGRYIVTASDDKTAKVWDANTGKEILTLKGHADLISSASFSPNGRYIVTASDDKTAKVWDANTGKEILTLKGHINSCNPVSFAPDGKRIVTRSSDDKIAKVWQLQ